MILFEGTNNIAVPFALTQNNIGVGGFIPFDITNDSPPANFDLIPSVIGTQIGGNGRKVRLFGSDNQSFTSPMGGDLDYTYIPGTTSLDRPLAAGQWPYATYAAANVQTGAGNARELVVLNTQKNASNPIVEATDTAITPVMAAFCGNLIVAAGLDNNAGSSGGARASAYTIQQDGTASLAFTKTLANTLSNHVFTSHSLLWGSLSSGFNVLVDSQTVHNGNSSSFSYNYTLYAYDGSGSLLWTSNPRAGTILQISVGSTGGTYVLGTRGPGEFLVSYGLNGILRWARSSNAVKIAAALDQGVVVGDNLIDGTGHHHVHITKFAVNGPQAWTVTYASQTANDDFLSQLQWIAGRTFICGQYVPATGNKGIFSAEYDQT